MCADGSDPGDPSLGNPRPACRVRASVLSHLPLGGSAMNASGSGLCTLAALARVLGTSFCPAPPQDAPKGAAGATLARFGDGLTVGDLLASWTAETGRKFAWRDGAGI